MRNISIGMIDNGMRVYITLSACQIYMDANISADERRRSITPFAIDGIILYHRSSIVTNHQHQLQIVDHEVCAFDVQFRIFTSALA